MYPEPDSAYTARCGKPNTTSRISKSFAKTSVSMPHVANQFTSENSYSAIPSCRREVGACVSWSTTAGNQAVLQCLSKYHRLKIFPGLNSATPYNCNTQCVAVRTQRYRPSQYNLLCTFSVHNITVTHNVLLSEHTVTDRHSTICYVCSVCTTLRQHTMCCCQNTDFHNVIFKFIYVQWHFAKHTMWFCQITRLQTVIIKFVYVRSVSPTIL